MVLFIHMTKSLQPWFYPVMLTCDLYHTCPRSINKSIDHTLTTTSSKTAVKGAPGFRDKQPILSKKEFKISLVEL